MRGMAEKRVKSDSTPQRNAEAKAIRRIERQFSIELERNYRIDVGEGRVHVDGFNKGAKRVTLVEVNAHVGKMKPAQRDKVLKDALKMFIVSRKRPADWHGKDVRRVLVFVDQEALSSFGPNSWGRTAFAALHTETVVSKCTRAERRRLQNAQIGQDIRNA